MALLFLGITITPITTVTTMTRTLTVLGDKEQGMREEGCGLRDKG